MNIIRYQQDIPISVEADIVIIGAGPAGCCAALAAAEAGCSTVLLEQAGFAGGMATAGLVGPLLGVYHWDSGKRIVDGIPYRILQEMERRGGADLTNKGMLVPFDPEIMKSVLDRMFRQSGVAVRYHTKFVKAVKQDSRLSYLVVADSRGLSAVKAKIFIDGTGNGDVAASAGVPFQNGSSDNSGFQPMTTVFRIGGVETAGIKDSENPETGYVATEIRKILLAAEKKGAVPKFGGPWIMRGSTLREGEAFVNIVRQWGDPSQPEELSFCEINGREDMFTLFNYMKQNIPALRRSFIIDSGAMVGIRDSRHFKGLGTLTLEQCLSQQDFDDSIALGGHIVDIHSTSRSNSQMRKTIPLYEIPYLTILVDEVDNLLLSGRMISVEYEVFASIRVMVTCMAIGQGAGTAAAIAVKQSLKPRSIPLPELSAFLKAGRVIRKCGEAEK
ncbi:MAG: FAD-dependent oxidoreductase [Spirochaetia bacterium]|nr:FAD-dependent oxidoreductase [Spirochaetia bacterium]